MKCWHNDLFVNSWSGQRYGPWVSCYYYNQTRVYRAYMQYMYIILSKQIPTGTMTETRRVRLRRRIHVTVHGSRSGFNCLNELKPIPSRTCKHGTRVTWFCITTKYTEPRVPLLETDYGGISSRCQTWFWFRSCTSWIHSMSPNKRSTDHVWLPGGLPRTQQVSRNVTVHDKLFNFMVNKLYVYYTLLLGQETRVLLNSHMANSVVNKCFLWDVRTRLYILKNH